jgi:hypothetical protein
MNKKQLIEEVAKKQNKYSDLVWYARSSSEHDNIPGVKENRKRIEESYADEVNALHEDDSNWQHGFHSGMVAALRYVLTIDELGLEQADEWFPELDS